MLQYLKKKKTKLPGRRLGLQGLPWGLDFLRSSPSCIAQGSLLIGRRAAVMMHAGAMSFFGLQLEDAHVLLCWLLVEQAVGHAQQAEIAVHVAVGLN